MRTLNDHCATCPARRLCLARELDGQALEALGHHLSPPVALQRGEYLYRHGDMTDVVHVVRSGAFKTVFVTRTGDEHVTALHFPGELFGLGGFSLGMHSESAIALDTSSVCRVRTSDLPALWSLGCDRSFLHLVGLQEMTGRLVRMRLSEPSAATRIASFLVERAHRQQRAGLSAETIYMPVSRTDLANYLGMTLECLSRTLGRLSRAGYCSTHRSSIDILQPEALATLAGNLEGSTGIDSSWPA